MAKTIVGLYNDKKTAEQVVKELHAQGFQKDRIHLRDQSSGGDLTNSLRNVGVPEEDAQYYQEGIRGGGYLVTVDSPDPKADEAASIMDRFDPIDVQHRFGGGLASNRRSGMESDAIRTGGLENDGEVTLPVTEEELQVGKRQTQTGGARIRTYMTEKPVEETVNLRHENVEVERRPVDRPIHPGEMDTFREGTIDIPETHEEAVVGKQARVVEEVSVRKNVEDEQKTIHDTVRRTDVETEDLGNQEFTGRETRSNTGRQDFTTRETGSNVGRQWESGTGRFQSFDTYEPTLRNHFKSKFGHSRYDYDYYRPAYRYGYDLATSENYSGQDWKSIEPEARRRWEAQNPNNKWDDFKDAVREGWRSVTNG